MRMGHVRTKYEDTASVRDITASVARTIRVIDATVSRTQNLIRIRGHACLVLDWVSVTLNLLPQSVEFLARLAQFRDTFGRIVESFDHPTFSNANVPGIESSGLCFRAVS